MLTRLILLAFTVASLIAAQPNFIWIVGEDLGPELGCYGDSYARTPNLDKLASEGVCFTRAFTHAPVCAPSRSGLIYASERAGTPARRRATSRSETPSPAATSPLRTNPTRAPRCSPSTPAMGAPIGVEPRNTMP